MSSARLIERNGQTFGLVVRLATGRFRFFSSTPAVDALDGRVFRSVAATIRAIEDVAAATRRS